VTTIFLSLGALRDFQKFCDEAFHFVASEVFSPRRSNGGNEAATAADDEVARMRKMGQKIESDIGMRDLCGHAQGNRDPPQSLHPQMAATPSPCRRLSGSWRSAVQLYAPAAESGPWRRAASGSLADLAMTSSIRLCGYPHHRRPTTAMTPAGRDPRARSAPKVAHSTAPFAAERQSLCRPTRKRRFIAVFDRGRKYGRHDSASRKQHDHPIAGCCPPPDRAALRLDGHGRHSS
jgi:hypothetical protein